MLSIVHLWGIHSARFELVIDQIERATNVFADILTRWVKGYWNSREQRTEMEAAIFEDIVPAASAHDLVKIMTSCRNRGNINH